MRIAIIGTGISGLAAARELCREHRVVLYESAGAPGGHANTVDVEVDGAPVAVDVGFIAFREATSPGFTRLLRELGTPSKPAPMGLSVRHEAMGLEYAAGRVFEPKRNLVRPGVWRMKRDAARFARDASAWLLEVDGGGRLADAGLTLGGFLERGGYSREFRAWFLEPMIAAAWLMGPGDASGVGFECFCRCFGELGLLDLGAPSGWRTVAGGSREYVRKLAAELAEAGSVIRTRDAVRWVRAAGGAHRYRENRRGAEGGVELVSAGGTDRFDAVVFATQSDTALDLLADPTTAEREVLGAMPYQEHHAVVHTDARLMPSRRSVWAAWNAHVGVGEAAGPSLAPPTASSAPRLDAIANAPARVTYNLNILQGLATRNGTQVMVTFNFGEAVDPRTTLRLIRSYHPKFTLAGFEAQKRFLEVSGVGRRFYCGSYWRNGLHEDGHWSGVRAAQQVRAWAARRVDGPHG